MFRSDPSHPRVSKNVVETPPDPENLDFLKIDVLLRKNIGFRRRRRPQIDPKWVPNAPK